MLPPNRTTACLSRPPLKLYLRKGTENSDGPVGEPGFQPDADPTALQQRLEKRQLQSGWKQAIRTSLRIGDGLLSVLKASPATGDILNLKASWRRKVEVQLNPAHVSTRHEHFRCQHLLSWPFPRQRWHLNGYGQEKHLSCHCRRQGETEAARCCCWHPRQPGNCETSCIPA